MQDYGYIRASIAVPKLFLTDVKANLKEHIRIIEGLVQKNTQFICFPELSLTGYTAGELFHQLHLIEVTLEALIDLQKISLKYPLVTIIVGAPIVHNGSLFNCAVIYNQGQIKAIIPKTYLPNYNEFKEKSYFQPCPAKTSLIYLSGFSEEILFGQNILFNDLQSPHLIFGVEICEDLWAPDPISTQLTLQGASIIFNLSASNEVVGKKEYRTRLVQQQSERCITAYCYVSSGLGESTMDLVFGGQGLIYENGELLGELERFQLESTDITVDIDVERLTAERIRNTVWSDAAQFSSGIIERVRIHSKLLDLTNDTLLRHIHPHPFIPFTPDSSQLNERCLEILTMQANGLAMRFQRSQAKNFIIGVSGGLDSTYALLVIIESCNILDVPLNNIHALTMPGFGTSETTKSGISDLCKFLGVNLEIIPIQKAVEQHLSDLNHQGEIDLTYENAQARERTQILFDKANQIDGIVVGTGDLSEIALGWMTFNGDHMSSYNVNAGVPKTLIQFLIKWYAKHKLKSQKARNQLLQILTLPISPELLPPSTTGIIQQRTEEVIGPFELHDFFLYFLVRYQFRPRKILYLAEIAFKSKYDLDSIQKWLKVFLQRFFKNQFKRSVFPDGPKIGSVSLSPRGQWRMPSDVLVTSWLAELNKINS